MVQRTIVSNQQTTIILVAAVTTAVTILGTYLYKRNKHPKIPTKWRPVGKVKTMSIFPMKSGKRIDVQHAECTIQGLIESEKVDKSFRLRDRAFLVYQEGTLQYRTARHYNKMVLVEIKPQGADNVVLNAPGMESLIVKVPVRGESQAIVIKFFQDEPIHNLDCGDEAAKWISNFFLGTDSGLRLCYNDGCYQRTHIPKVYQHLNDFFHRDIRTESAGLNSDITAMSLMTQSSVDDVNRRIDGPPVPAESYRPSLLMEGPHLEPFEEDDWVWIKVGNDVIMKNVIECWRCVMTTINMETGMKRDDKEPLKTMSKYRISKGPEKDPVMGVMCEVFRTGTISVGDTVYVGTF